jgi:hypothetical protein
MFVTPVDVFESEIAVCLSAVPATWLTSCVFTLMVFCFHIGHAVFSVSVPAYDVSVAMYLTPFFFRKQKDTLSSALMFTMVIIYFSAHAVHDVPVFAENRA